MPTDFSWSGYWCAIFSSLNKSLIAFAWRFYQMKVRSRVNFLTRFAVPSLMTCSKMETQTIWSIENLFERMCLGTFKVLKRWEGFVCQRECLGNRLSSTLPHRNSGIPPCSSSLWQNIKHLCRPFSLYSTPGCQGSLPLPLQNHALRGTTNLAVARYSAFPKISLKKKLLPITLNSKIKESLKQDPI